MIVKIRNQNEYALARFFLAYFRDLINKYEFELLESDLTKKIFSLEEQKKINIEVNELRKGLNIVFSSNIEMLRAFDCALDNVFRENGIAYMRVVLAEEKSGNAEVERANSWIKSGDFSIINRRECARRFLQYTNDKSCLINKIWCIDQGANTVIVVYINKNFFQNYREAVAKSNLQGELEEADHSMVIADEDCLNGFLDFLSALDKSILTIKDEIVSLVSPHIIKKIKFFHWAQKGDFSKCFADSKELGMLQSSVEYVCSKDRSVFKRVKLLRYPEKCFIEVEVKEENYEDIIARIANGFPECGVQCCYKCYGFDIPSTQVLSNFLDHLATFDSDVLELKDHIICSYDPAIIQNQKAAFLMGLYPKLRQSSSASAGMAAFAGNRLFDRNTINEVFAFFDPYPKAKDRKKPINITNAIVADDGLACRAGNAAKAFKQR